MSNFILGLDIGSYEVKANIAKFDDDTFSISGIGKAKTSGVKKGLITNIEQASTTIKQAVLEATKSSGTRFDSVVVSLSGAYAKYTKSTGVITIPAGEITINEITRAMQIAGDNANIPTDHVKLHILPYNFKIDEQDHIEDPLGMIGSRLEVFVHIITVPKNAIKNLEKSVQMAGLKIDNIVLSGYASAIATTTKEEKELGVCVIDMGGATCDIVVHNGNSLIHNDVLLIGSSNITSDLSKALHTPISNAEAVKINYQKLIESNCDSIELPTLGENSSVSKINMEIIANIIYSRLEETLMFLYQKLSNSGYMDKIVAGIVLTGGMAKLDDIRQITMAIFNNMPVRVSTPRKTTGGLFEISNDCANSCVIGLCLYGSGEFTPYEIDSNGVLRYKDEIKKINSKINNYENQIKEALGDDTKSTQSELIINNEKIKKEGIITRILNRFSKIF